MTNAELIAKFLDNTASKDNYEELGILQFGKILFPELFDSKFSELHYEMAILLLDLLNPLHKRRLERQRYFNVHREASKSTLGSFLFPTYLLYLKGYSPYVAINGRTYKLPPIKEDFIVITSETSARAEQFVTDIKATIDTRPDLIDLFGEKNPKYMQIEAEHNKRKRNELWRQNAFMTADGTVVWGLGAGQRIRGIKVAGKRPSLIIVDDMYSRANTKTQQTREHLNYWFFSELANSTDSVKGKILWLGTLVHQDTVLTKFEKSENWKGIKRPIISLPELNKLIGQWKDSGIDEVPDRIVMNEWQKEYNTLSWPDRHDLWYILKLYKDAADHHDYDYFYQEYMNVTKAPETMEIDEKSFVQTPVSIYKSNDYNTSIQYAEFTLNNVKFKGEVVLAIGVDPATSTNLLADDTVISVFGYCRAYFYQVGYDEYALEKKQRDGLVLPVIPHIEGGKYSIHDYEGRPGICERLIQLVKQYEISHIIVEAQGQQKAIVDEIRRTFYEKGVMVPVIEEYTNLKKEERIHSVLTTIVQRYKHIICNPNPLIHKMFVQLISLGMGDHDDYPDSVAMAAKLIQPPETRLSGIVLAQARKEDEQISHPDYWQFQ